MKFKTMKFSSEGLGGNSAKFCTSKNFPAIWYYSLHYCLWQSVKHFIKRASKHNTIIVITLECMKLTTWDKNGSVEWPQHNYSLENQTTPFCITGCIASPAGRWEGLATLAQLLGQMLELDVTNEISARVMINMSGVKEENRVNIDCTCLE